MKINNIDYTIYKQYGTNENSKKIDTSKSLEEIIKCFLNWSLGIILKYLM